jgi:3-dehydroquinate synthase/shikimate kinase/3-dehydroquinate synthase
MLKDKKNKSDKISLVLLKRIGSPLINKEYDKKNLYSFLKKELNN